MAGSLSDLQVFVNECNQSNSSKAKMEVVRAHPEVQELLKYTYDKINYTYGVSSSNIKKIASQLNIGFPAYTEITDLLNALNNREITGHGAISEILAFIENNKEYEELILNIIDRNLKTRTDSKLINKIYPGCIPQFDVALANPIEEYDPDRTKIDFIKQEWFASRKLDGCRLATLVYPDGTIKTMSRNGKEFWTLQVIKDAITELGITNVAFDGEICMVDENDLENFQMVMKYIRKKDYTIPNPRYKIFDMIPLPDFEALEGEVLLSDRQVELHNTIPTNNPVLSVLEQWRVKDWDDLDRLKEQAAELGWEGLIVRKNIPYEGKRSNNMLKVKMFMDDEFIVDAVEMGPIRHIAYKPDGTSYEKEEEMLSAVMFTYKDKYTVRCGSGFSLDERKYYHKHPDELIGREITVKYFEATVNQEGGESIRFPTCKRIWPEGGRAANE